MSKFAVISQRGPLIEVSADGQHPLDGEIVRKLTKPLVYTHLEYRRGQAAYNPATGLFEKVISEQRRLYQVSSSGCLCCQKGFRHKIARILRDDGYVVHYVNYDPAKAGNVYRADWNRVYELFQFRPGQEICLGQVDMHDEGVIEAVPAFGKSYMFGMIGALYPHAKIDIVTKSKSVVATIRRHITRWLPDIGQVGGGKRKKRRVTVYTAGSLKHSDFDADIVLADEVHELMTDRYAEWLSRYWYARMFGFTATKETRFDNAYHRMEGIFGPTIFKMDYPLAEQLGLVAPIIVQWLSVSPRYNPCRELVDATARKRHGIWRHDYRNQTIAGAAQSFVNDGYQTLILVETLEHALYLRQYLPDFQLCYSEQAINSERRDFLVSSGLLGADENMTAQHRDMLRRGFEDRAFLGAIATGVWSVGVSFDSLQVLVRADGGASETNNLQAPGRVCRIDASGKPCGIVLDLQDEFDDKFMGWGVGRRRAYNQNGWRQFLPDGQLWTPRRTRVGCAAL
jgi:superfamily II DNA or RNA helicase